ncbi:olfactory receptor 14A16-like [Sorex araneus]|uniref:olfactory receptor 14A16-like n=1 Tax=Sorex araneus TaxID=42254 RepID=UPI002433A2E3|nr:olfactory receptor 14A16-like [Sorex araneus]
MYFFLKHLSLLDLCYISVTVPRFIYNSFTHSGNISLWECILQCFALISCGSAEVSMLTVMSYDRYVAICLPLRYDDIMDVRTCVHGVSGVWVSGAISGVMHTAATFSIHFCGPRVIHQFFCDIPQLLRLSCSIEYLGEPHSDSPTASDIFLTILYTVVPPTFNPVIYSLRNKAIKLAISKVFQRRAGYLFC